MRDLLTKSLVLIICAVFIFDANSEEDKNYLGAFPNNIKVKKSDAPLKAIIDGNTSIKRSSMGLKDRSQFKKLNQQEISKKLRAQNPAKATNAYGFEIFDAYSYLDYDGDGNGYFSEFTVEFDADFDGGYADVYAVIYYSLDGGDWIELFETEVFTIYSNDTADLYSVSFELNEGFPTSEYDLLIDLYEYGYVGIVDTVDSSEDADLYALPLEDSTREVYGYTSNIGFVATELSGDSDRDGFYTDLTIEYDISAGVSGDIVHAEIIMKNPARGWQQKVYSDDFVLGTQTEFLDLTFNSGYPAGYYDIEINLVHSLTGESITSASYEFSSLNGLSIESTNNDNYYNSTNSSPDVEIVVSGGGAFGYGMGLFILIMTLLKRRK